MTNRELRRQAKVIQHRIRERAKGDERLRIAEREVDTESIIDYSTILAALERATRKVRA